jgi:hypothetical protein
MPLAIKLSLVTNNFLDVVAKLISENIAAPQAKLAELSVVIAAPRERLLSYQL